MKATIYHNPMCGTSRKTLDILRDSGCDVWIHEYMKTPPTREELVRLYQRAGISPREGLRAKEPLADIPDAERIDLALQLVRNGLVLASCDAPRSYADAEDDARGRKQSLWGRVTVPEYKRRCTK